MFRKENGKLEASRRKQRHEDYSESKASLSDMIWQSSYFTVTVAIKVTERGCSVPFSLGYTKTHVTHTGNPWQAGYQPILYNGKSFDLFKLFITIYTTNIKTTCSKYRGNTYQATP